MDIDCLVVSCNATLDIGGETIFARGLANELKANKNINSTFLLRNEIVGAELIPDLQRYHYKLPRIKNPVLLVFSLFQFTIFAIPKGLSSIKTKRKKGKSIIIHAHDGAFSGFAGIIIGKLSNTPVIITFHGTHILSAFFIFKKLSRIGSIVASFLNSFCIHNTQSIVTVDPKTKIFLNSEIKENKKIVVIPTFCRELNSQKHSLEESLFPILPPNSKIIGYAGRLSPEKNAISLVEAYNEISKRVPDTYLMIAGDGVQKEKIIIRAKELGIESKVFLLGYVQNVGLFLSKLSCIVLPSKSEGFPMIILEAWSSGVPVIASNCIPFLENGRNSITFPSDDLEKQIESLMRILSNSELVQSIKNEASKELESFSRDAVVEKYSRLFIESLQDVQST